MLFLVTALVASHLFNTQETHSTQAALIEYNLTAVDAAINAVREALASGLDWRELGQMIKAERRAGNPVAGLIDSLALEKNKITVVLENSLDEDDQDDDAMTRPATKVSIGSLALDKNKITVVLENSVDENDQNGDAMTPPAIKVSRWTHWHVADGVDGDVFCSPALGGLLVQACTQLFAQAGLQYQAQCSKISSNL